MQSAPERSLHPTLIECSLSEEKLFVSGHGTVEANLHAHSTRSDGQLSLRQIADIAQRKRRNIAITDHNIPPEFPGAWPPGLIPGMEVTTAEGVDVLVYDTLKGIWRLFDECIRSRLHPTRPRSCATKLSLHDLLKSAHIRLMPHIANVEGLSLLQPEEQDAALRYPGVTLLEINALATRRHNDDAHAKAVEWGLPLVRTGDTHRGEEQYSGSWSGLPLHLLEDSKEPLIARFLRSVHTHHASLQHDLYPVTSMERLATGAQVFRKNGLRATVYFGWKTALRMFGWRPRIQRKNAIKLKPKPA